MELRSGLTFKTPLTGNNTFTINKVTDKKVSWSRNDGLTQKRNVNKIRIFSTSLRIANRMVAENHWQFQN